MSNDITSNYHGGNRESTAASLDNQTRARVQRDRIVSLANVRRARGITCDEAEVLLDISHQSCSARFSELKRDGILLVTGVTRKTRAGSDARVMVVNLG